jgi:peptidoglycan/LPS O-acetylase OafA/YrhL
MVFFHTVRIFDNTRVDREYGNMEITVFLIRRLFRIVPLARVAMLVILTLVHATGYQYLAHLWFFANLPPIALVDVELAPFV